MATNTEKIVIQVQVKGQKQIGQLERGVKKASKSTGGLTRNLIKMGAVIGSAVIIYRQLNKTIGFAIRTFKDFEFQMSKVRAITGASDADFKKLNDTAQDLGRTTFFTATQVAELQTNYGKLGFTTQEILDAQGATLDLATATGSDLARAATVAGAAVRGFGLDASETQRVVDVMAVSFTSSAMDLEKWQTSMTKVAPIAKSAGFSIEDTAAIMSKLTDSGIEASIAGTSLRNILLKMQDPTSDLTKSFGKTIHSFDQLVPAMKKFVKGGGSMADIMEVVDLRQAAAFEQMITSADSAEELRDAMKQATGAAKEMADIVGDNLEGAVKRITSAWQGLWIVITESVVGGWLQGFLDGTAQLINHLTLLSEGYSSLADKSFKLAKGFQAEKTRTEELITKYAQLDGILDKTKAEKIELDLVTKDLEDRIGDSVKIINEETGALILNSEALDAAIARHAILADEEAIKLVHQLRKVGKGIKENNDELGEYNSTINQNQNLLDVLSQTTEDVIVQQEDEANQVKMLNAEGEEQNKVITEQTYSYIIQDKALEGKRKTTKGVVLQTEKQIEVTEEINKLEGESHAITLKNNGLKSEQEELWAKLNELGYTAADVAALEAGELKKLKSALDEVKKGTKEYNEEKEKYSSGALEFLAETKADLWNKLMGEVVDGTKTMQDAEDEFAKDQIAHIEHIQETYALSNEEATKLEKALIALKLKGMDDEQKKRKETQEAAFQVAQEFSDAMFSIDNENRDRRQRQTLKTLEERKESGVITQEQYEKEVDTINRQAFDREKSSNIAQALMNGALAITQLFATTPTPMSFGLLAPLIAATAGQVAIIAAQKYADGGMVYGNSHGQGGEKFAVGGRVVELEGGESVINKRSTAMYRPLLSSINSMGGGVKFADGGLLNQAAFSQTQFNALGQAGMMGAISQGNKVVVVESDITNSQNTVSVIQSQAAF